MSDTATSRRRNTFLVCALLVAVLTAGCSDDEDKPLAPDTGRDLETPTSQLTPPSPPEQ